MVHNMATTEGRFIIAIMRNKIICIGFILLEIIIVCGSRESPLSRERDGRNLHERHEGMKARRRKRETEGESSTAAATADKGRLLSNVAKGEGHYYA